MIVGLYLEKNFLMGLNSVLHDAFFEDFSTLEFWLLSGAITVKSV